jgi:UDP-2,3-diacylglucosamine pyrophosphatase LpxH
VCGHIHRPEIKELNGVLYCNDGDWIESCTALVEDETGDLSILNWAEERERLKLIYFEEKKKMKENAA